MLSVTCIHTSAVLQFQPAAASALHFLQEGSNKVTSQQSDTFAVTDFVPVDLDCGDFASVKPLFQSLLDREITSASDLENWLLDISELESAIEEEGTLRYIAMTCQTDDKEKAQAFRDFQENVVPRIKPLVFAINKKFVDCEYRKDLDHDRYEVLDRDLTNEVELFREENVPLETELSGLSQDYDTICGAMSVTVDGEELTLPQATRLLEETDRSLRQRAWKAIADRRLKDADAIRGIYEKMLPLRQQVASNAGFDNFRDYAFRSLRRFDYNPKMCEAFHAGVEKYITPLRKQLLAERAQTMGLDSLRPWDTLVDPHGREPLRPFETADELVDGADRIFKRMDSTLGDLFAELRDGTSLDLESRKGKAPGGYQATRNRQRKPFIFMNAAGTARDVETMLHESGHAFHTLLCREDPLNHYREGFGAEIAEVASMTMELFSYDFLDEFYNQKQSQRHRRHHLEGIILVLGWIAQIDAFQHWIYTHPGHDARERNKIWLSLDERFSPGIDWSGLEQYREEYWQKQLHLFGVPFYYIEYGIAQIGAIGLYRQYRQDSQAALTNYRQALTLGGSRPLPDLYAAAGLPFDFGPQVIEQCADLVNHELAQLPA